MDDLSHMDPRADNLHAGRSLLQFLSEMGENNTNNDNNNSGTVAQEESMDHVFHPPSNINNNRTSPSPSPSSDDASPDHVQYEEYISTTPPPTSGHGLGVGAAAAPTTSTFNIAEYEFDEDTHTSDSSDVSPSPFSRNRRTTAAAADGGSPESRLGERRETMTMKSEPIAPAERSGDPFNLNVINNNNSNNVPLTTVSPGQRSSGVFCPVSPHAHPLGGDGDPNKATAAADAGFDEAPVYPNAEGRRVLVDHLEGLDTAAGQTSNTVTRQTPSLTQLATPKDRDAVFGGGVQNPIAAAAATPGLVACGLVYNNTNNTSDDLNGGTSSRMLSTDPFLEQEHVAVACIQAAWRGYRLHKVWLRVYGGEVRRVMNSSTELRWAWDTMLIGTSVYNSRHQQAQYVGVHALTMAGFEYFVLGPLWVVYGVAVGVAAWLCLAMSKYVVMFLCEDVAAVAGASQAHGAAWWSVGVFVWVISNLIGSVVTAYDGHRAEKHVVAAKWSRARVLWTRHEHACRYRELVDTTVLVSDLRRSLLDLFVCTIVSLSVLFPDSWQAALVSIAFVLVMEIVLIVCNGNQIISHMVSTTYVLASVQTIVSGTMPSSGSSLTGEMGLRDATTRLQLQLVLATLLVLVTVHRRIALHTKATTKQVYTTALVYRALADMPMTLSSTLSSTSGDPLNTDINNLSFEMSTPAAITAATNNLTAVVRRRADRSRSVPIGVCVVGVTLFLIYCFSLWGSPDVMDCASTQYECVFNTTLPGATVLNSSTVSVAGSSSFEKTSPKVIGRSGLGCYADGSATIEEMFETCRRSGGNHSNNNNNVLIGIQWKPRLGGRTRYVAVSAVTKMWEAKSQCYSP
eukprot:PhM_4_TR12312/c0_g2_i1/m.53085